MALDQTFKTVDSNVHYTDSRSTEAGTSPGGHARVCGRFDLADSGRCSIVTIVKHLTCFVGRLVSEQQSKDGTLGPHAQRSCGLRYGQNGKLPPRKRLCSLGSEDFCASELLDGS